MITVSEGSGIVENFTFEEMASRGELKSNTEIAEFMNMLQDLRNWAASTFEIFKDDGLITSNIYRTEEHNRDVGGSKNSIHLNCRAADFTNVPKHLYNEFTTAWQVICRTHNKIGGINLYDWGIHVDNFEDKFGHKEFVIRSL